MSELLFTFSSEAVPDDAHVVGFRGNEGLSELYRFEIGLALRDDRELDLAGAVGCRAALTFHTALGPQTYHGVIAQAELLHAWAGHTLYRVVLVPKVWFLTTSRHSWVWVDKDTPAILTAILAENNALTADDFELRLSGRYAPRDFVCQYDESDFAFLSRWLEREGIYYYFEHGEKREKLILCDDKARHTTSRTEGARYLPSSAGDHMALEAFDVFRQAESASARSVVEHDFDYLKPLLELRGEDSSEGRHGGIVVRHGENAQSPAEAAALARVRAGELRARATAFTASGRVFQLRAGYRFALEGHPRAELNGQYLAVGVVHQGNQSAGAAPARALLGLEGDDEYQVKVSAIHSEVQYRPAQKTPRPRIYGLERAFIDGEKDSDYAQIDEHGRYRVRFHFDESAGAARAGMSSAWVRMLQPHGGNPEGFHLPLRKTTEVLVSFIAGDPDRPVISGVVPNLLNPSPVTRDNHTQNVIQTGGRNRIEMEDEEGAQYLDLSTPPKNTFLHLGAAHGSHQHNVVLHTEGSSLIDVQKSHTMNVGIDNDVHVKGNRTVDVTGFQATTTGQHFGVKAGAHVDVQAGTHISATAGAHVAVLAGTNVSTTAGANIIEVAGGSITVMAGGSISETAPVVGINGGALIAERAPLIVISASGAVTVSAPLVTVAGGVVDVNGGSVNVNGGPVNVNGSPVNITGGDVNIKGSVINLNT